jgi:hypothetical protein
MELTSESDIWKWHAKSCTKNPNLKRIMIKILILITVIDCTEVFIEIPLSSMKPEKQNKVYQYGKSSQNLVNSIYFFPDEYG